MADEPVGEVHALTTRPNPAAPGIDIVVAVCLECARRPDRNERDRGFDEMFEQYRSGQRGEGKNSQVICGVGGRKGGRVLHRTPERCAGGSKCVVHPGSFRHRSGNKRSINHRRGAA